jgi:hypothetical protein
MAPHSRTPLTALDGGRAGVAWRTHRDGRLEQSAGGSPPHLAEGPLHDQLATTPDDIDAACRVKYAGNPYLGHMISDPAKVARHASLPRADA